MGKPHYTYTDIRFCPRQVYFIIENFLALKKDTLIVRNLEWPPDPSILRPDEGTYITKRASSDARFCKPMEIVAEVRNRLSRCERNGKLLVASVMGGIAHREPPRGGLANPPVYKRVEAETDFIQPVAV